MIWGGCSQTLISGKVDESINLYHCLQKSTTGDFFQGELAQFKELHALDELDTMTRIGEGKNTQSSS